MTGTHFKPEMLRIPAPSTAGPSYVGVLRITVVSAVFPKRMKAACSIRLGRQSVTTKVNGNENECNIIGQ